MRKSLTNTKKPLKLKPKSFYVIADEKTGKWSRFDVYFTEKEAKDTRRKENEVIVKKEFKQ